MLGYTWEQIGAYVLWLGSFGGLAAVPVQLWIKARIEANFERERRKEEHRLQTATDENRHQQAQEIQQQVAELEGRLKGSIHVQEKELVLLERVWEATGKIFNRVRGFAFPLTRPTPDFGELPAYAVQEVLQESGLTGDQRARFAFADDKEKCYKSAIFQNHYAVIRTEFVSYLKLVSESAIYFPETLGDTLRKASKIIEEIMTKMEMGNSTDMPEFAVSAWRQFEDKLTRYIWILRV